MPCQRGGAIGGGTRLAPCLDGLGGGVQGDLRAHHDVERVELSQNAALCVGRGKERAVFVRREVIEQLCVHIRVEQKVSAILRDVGRIELRHQRQHVGLGYGLAVTRGRGGVCGNGLTGRLYDIVGRRAPIMEEVKRHGVEQGEFVLSQYRRSLVVRQLHRIGMRYDDGIRRVLVERKVDVGVVTRGCLGGHC